MKYYMVMCLRGHCGTKHSTEIKFAFAAHDLMEACDKARRMPSVKHTRMMVYGKEITEQEAYLRLTALCAQAEHCQHEMLEKMKKWELADEAQARVMERLIKERYVDDERYARAFVMDKIRYNKWGRRKVEQALWMKRIDKGIQERVLSEVDDEEYVSALRPLLKQKQRSTKAASDYELRQKLIRFALSRGFGFDIIRQCIDVEDEDELLD